MKITGQAPAVEIRQASVISPLLNGVDPDKVKPARRVWRPTDAKAVYLMCGCLTTDWPFVKALGIVDGVMPGSAVWCERHGEWSRIDHYATPIEIAGITPLVPPDSDIPPF